MTLTYGSLFSGVGCFDLALERSGMTCMWQVEIDPKCREVLDRHWPKVRKFSDVKEVDSSVLAPVDLIIGGFPCQDISTAGGRAGLDGARSGLWWEFHRIIDLMAPRWVVIENVDGLRSSGNPRGSDMGAVLGALGDLGYGFAYRVLDAQWFGVPQRRRRVFVVGCLGDAAGPAEVLLEPESGGGDPQAFAATRSERAGRPATRTGTDGVVSALTSAYRHGPDLAHAEAGWIIPTEETSKALSTKGNRQDSSVEDARRLFRNVSAETTNVSTDDYETWVPDDVSNTLNTFDISEPRTTHAVVAPLVAGTLLASAARESSSGGGGMRNDLDSMTYLPVVFSIYPESGQGADLKATECDVAPSLTATAEAESTDRGVRIAEEVGVRRLTPLECERLQGLPDNWTEGLTDTARYKAIGNGGAVPVVEWIGKRIIIADDPISLAERADDVMRAWFMQRVVAERAAA